MKVLDKFNLVLFSIIILALSLIICLLSFRCIPLELALDSVEFIVINKTANNITLGISIILILCAMKKKMRVQTTYFLEWWD